MLFSDTSLYPHTGFDFLVLGDAPSSVFAAPLAKLAVILNESTVNKLNFASHEKIKKLDQGNKMYIKHMYRHIT